MGKQKKRKRKIGSFKYKKSERVQIFEKTLILEKIRNKYMFYYHLFLKPTNI